MKDKEISIRIIDEEINNLKNYSEHNLNYYVVKIYNLLMDSTKNIIKSIYLYLNDREKSRILLREALLNIDYCQVIGFGGSCLGINKECEDFKVRVIISVLERIFNDSIPENTIYELGTETLSPFLNFTEISHKIPENSEVLDDKELNIPANYYIKDYVEIFGFIHNYSSLGGRKRGILDKYNFSVKDHTLVTYKGNAFLQLVIVHFLCHLWRYNLDLSYHLPAKLDFHACNTFLGCGKHENKYKSLSDIKDYCLTNTRGKKDDERKKFLKETKIIFLSEIYNDNPFEFIKDILVDRFKAYSNSRIVVFNKLEDKIEKIAPKYEVFCDIGNICYNHNNSFSNKKSLELLSDSSSEFKYYFIVDFLSIPNSKKYIESYLSNDQCRKEEENTQFIKDTIKSFIGESEYDKFNKYNFINEPNLLLDINSFTSTMNTNKSNTDIKKKSNNRSKKKKKHTLLDEYKLRKDSNIGFRLSDTDDWITCGKIIVISGNRHLELNNGLVIKEAKNAQELFKAIISGIESDLIKIGYTKDQITKKCAEIIEKQKNSKTNVIMKYHISINTKETKDNIRQPLKFIPLVERRL